MSTTFLATAVAIGFPWAYSLRRSSFSWKTFVSLLLLVHSIAGLYTLFLLSSPNIFKVLKVPLNTPIDVVKALLLQQSETGDLDAELDDLLRRLSFFEIRALYPRFGHNVIATCTYCRSFEEFALYSLPRPIMSYLREAAFNGLISTSRRRVAVLSLFLMFVLEVYILTTVEIKVLPSPQPFMTIWWHDIFFNIRRIVFILLPLAVHFSPSIRIPFISGPTPPPKIDTSLLLVQSHQAISHLLPALHLLKYGQAAIMRVPDLRVRASSWWEEEAKVGAWIMEDGVQDSEGSTRQNVRGVARSLGTSFDESGDGVEEGKLRTNAKIMAKVLMIDALKPSPNWQQ